MWNYEKRLQFPVKIKTTCPKTAQLIISQYGGPDGELSASMRYLAQRYTMPVKQVGGLLTDIGTEELAHMEIICAMVYQLTKDLTPQQVKEAGFDAYYIDHTTGLWPQAAAGLPFSAIEFQSKGDAITDLTENLAAEQKARVVYENLLRVIKEPDVREPLKFLRAREIVHFQRFGEALEKTKEKLDEKNFYYFNPEFDKQMLKDGPFLS
ncbi:MAG: manganese catalase family protein [Lachnospiraceae bacterium]|nr:manganese catalase family protein [Lachnospiraceae bacterium]MDD6192191.1 manganese catalase family protein [Lachnospiraceae bacterium]MDY4793055.1 manganese catalase family protein [Pararoseburia sp.]